MLDRLQSYRLSARSDVALAKVGGGGAGGWPRPQMVIFLKPGRRVRCLHLTERLLEGAAQTCGSHREPLVTRR